LKQIIDQLVGGFFKDSADEFRAIYDSLLLYNDEFFVLKDFNAYVESYNELVDMYKDREKWSQCSLVNIVNSGKFSSDRTIKEYAEDIWKVRCR